MNGIKKRAGKVDSRMANSTYKAGIDLPSRRGFLDRNPLFRRIQEPENPSRDHRSTGERAVQFQVKTETHLIKLETADLEGGRR
jgi:hypothetical protein